MQEIKLFAPVIIPTSNRYNHLKSCVESLAKCSGAEETELFISVDYPPSEKYKKGHNEIIEYVKNIIGFKVVHIYIQEKNLGGYGNLFFLRNEVLKNYDRMIFTEDDNIFSPCFLEYINKGLEIFKDDKRIWGICGYNYSIEIPNSYSQQYNYYFSKEYSAWGAGYFNKMLDLDVDRSVDNGKLLLKKYWSKLTWNARNELICSIKHNRFPGDLYRILLLIDSEMYCVFPTDNLVVNKGHDGSGINCGYNANDIYSVQAQSIEKHFEFKGNPPICEDKRIRKKLDKYFDIPFKSKIKIFIQKLLLN